MENPFEGAPSFEEEKDIFELSQEDFGNLRSLAAEDPESLPEFLEAFNQKLAAEEKGLELQVEEGGELDVEINGEEEKLYGFKLSKTKKEGKEGDLEMPEAA